MVYLLCWPLRVLHFWSLILGVFILASLPFCVSSSLRLFTSASLHFCVSSSRRLFISVSLHLGVSSSMRLFIFASLHFCVSSSRRLFIYAFFHFCVGVVVLILVLVFLFSVFASLPCLSNKDKDKIRLGGRQNLFLVRGVCEGPSARDVVVRPYPRRNNHKTKTR